MVKHLRYLARSGIALLVLGGLAISGTGAQTGIDINTIQADELFRLGVARFHDAYHAEAAVLFQKVLALKPEDNLARVWLGKSYYLAGFEEAALKEFQSLSEAGAAGPDLKAFIENQAGRRGLGRIQEDGGYFNVKDVDKNTSRPNQIRRPGGMTVMPDGSTWLCSFANNALIRMAATGKALQTVNGRGAGLSGPFDMVMVASRELHVTQMTSDQVNRYDLAGRFLGSYGASGSGPGQFLGPQYITWDGGDHVFVSDMGNRRISCFTLDGSFVFSFGEEREGFRGMERPTGILWHDGKLLAADGSRKSPAIHSFDSAGNFLETFADGRLAGVEALEEGEDGQVLVTVRDHVYAWDPGQNIMKDLVAGDGGRFVSARFDLNGHLLVTDFDKEVLTYNSRLRGAQTGLSVQIQRVVSDRFPDVVVECNVLDDRGKPVLGLSKDNFLVTEGLKDLKDVQFLGSGSRENHLEVCILVQGGASRSDPALQEAWTQGLEGIVQALGSRAAFSMVGAGSQGMLAAPSGSTPKELSVALENLPVEDWWALDAGIRQGVSQLSRSQGIRHVVFIGEGSLPDDAFARFGLEENLRYLQNNRVRFSFIKVGQGAVDPAITYLVRESGGVFHEVFEPRGLGVMGEELALMRDGSYRFSYHSLFDSDFGRKYLPVEVQARHFQKSGRDDSGYFGPLKM